jgi:hypothetical protein
VKGRQTNRQGWLIRIAGCLLILFVVALAGYRVRSQGAAATLPTAPVVNSTAPTATAPSAALAISVPSPALAPSVTVPPTQAPPATTVGTIATPPPAAGTTTAVPDVRLQQAAEQLSRHFLQEGMVTSGDACDQLLKQGTCEIFQGVSPLLRPEWQQLLPHTDFFLLKSTSVSKPGDVDLLVTPVGAVLAQQDGRIYRVNDFPQLLDANGIVISDQNRELVMKAFALMTLGAYLEDDVHFNDPEAIDLTSGLSHYTYRLKIWTKLQGVELAYLFEFYNSRLGDIRGGLIEPHTGDYHEVPIEQLPLLTQNDISYNFIGR